MLEACGLKGHRIGGAQISPMHANFIENAGDARTADALALMNEARRRAFEQYGVELRHEVELPRPARAAAARRRRARAPRRTRPREPQDSPAPACPREPSPTCRAQSAMSAGRLLPSSRSVAVGLILAALAVCAYVGARETPVFAIHTIEVEGAPPALGRQRASGAPAARREEPPEAQGRRRVDDLRRRSRPSPPSRTTVPSRTRCACASRSSSRWPCCGALRNRGSSRAAAAS